MLVAVARQVVEYKEGPDGRIYDESSIIFWKGGSFCRRAERQAPARGKGLACLLRNNFILPATFSQHTLMSDEPLARIFIKICVSFLALYDTTVPLPFIHHLPAFGISHSTFPMEICRYISCKEYPPRKVLSRQPGLTVEYGLQGQHGVKG